MEDVKAKEQTTDYSQTTDDNWLMRLFSAAWNTLYCGCCIYYYAGNSTLFPPPPQRVHAASCSTALVQSLEKARVCHCAAN